MGKTDSHTNYLRRGLGLLVGGAPLLLLVASLVHGLTGGDQRRPAGLVAETIGLLVGGLNFYLSFVRRPLYLWKTGSPDGYRNVSGLPMIGSMLVILGVLLGFGSAVSAVVGLAAIAADTGGSVWFVIFTWRDVSFWDAPLSRRKLTETEERGFADVSARAQRPARVVSPAS